MSLPDPALVCVIRHLAFEDLGVFAGEFAARRWPVQVLQAGVDDLAPAADADVLVVLGGPIGVYEHDRYPFIVDELDLLRQRIADQRATLGVCLGAQLLAEAGGGGVHPGHGKEIGWGTLSLTDDGAAGPLQHLHGVPVLHWHGDTYDPPPQATVLAGTARYAQQAFAIGSHTLALQFHPEVDLRRFEQWLIGHACELGQAAIDPRTLRDAMPTNHGTPAGILMLREWLDRLNESSGTVAASRQQQRDAAMS